MKVNELRIGNLIQCYRLAFDKHKTIQKIVGIFNTENVGYCVEIEDGMIINVENGVEAVPLTEEWLIKFGFVFFKKKPGTQGVYTNGKMNLAVSNSGNVYRVHQLIPHVHQLQNLYFALTGEELTIKP